MLGLVLFSVFIFILNNIVGEMQRRASALSATCTYIIDAENQ